jgi:pimeloyl-ACP methyl ester carboxylesterase
MSEDAYAVLHQVSTDSAVVIGFSDGAVIAADLATKHPEAIKKLIFIGGNPFPQPFRLGRTDDEKATTGPSIVKKFSDFFKKRKALMP